MKKNSLFIQILNNNKKNGVVVKDCQRLAPMTMMTRKGQRGRREQGGERKGRGEGGGSRGGEKEGEREEGGREVGG